MYFATLDKNVVMLLHGFIRRKRSTRRTSSKGVSSRPVSRSSDKAIFLLAAALIVVIGGYLFLTGKAGAPKTPVMKIASIVLDAQNKLGESGAATIKEIEGGRVMVTLDLTGAPKGVAQHAHIHMGACPNPGEVVYSLTSPVDGKSETTLDVSFDELMRELPLAVNVHKSVAQSKVYVACGNVTAPIY
ncbi:MAG: hypothetical protein AAB599_03570 [Patescibacteria group bacterium]